MLSEEQRRLAGLPRKLEEKTEDPVEYDRKGREQRRLAGLTPLHEDWSRGEIPSAESVKPLVTLSGYNLTLKVDKILHHSIEIMGMEHRILDAKTTFHIPVHTYHGEVMLKLKTNDGDTVKAYYGDPDHPGKVLVQGGNGEWFLAKYRV